MTVMMTTPLELILYATPTGPLAAACERFWRAADQGPGPTLAQTYPPHASLTGFFRRSAERLPSLIENIEEAIDGASPRSAHPIAVMGLVAHESWLGLQLESPWLDRFIQVICLLAEPVADEDALRPKDWLHLSLAYGKEEPRPDIDAYYDLAEPIVDPGLDAGWNLDLWERRPNGSWHCHRSWPLTLEP